MKELWKIGFLGRRAWVLLAASLRLKEVIVLLTMGVKVSGGCELGVHFPRQAEDSRRASARSSAKADRGVGDDDARFGPVGYLW